MTSSILLLAGAALATLRAKSDSANHCASVDLVAGGGARLQQVSGPVGAGPC